MNRKKPSRKARPKNAVERVQAKLDPGCQGTELDLELDRKLEREGYWFDVDLANRIQFFFEEHLRQSKGEFGGQRMVLQPWQQRPLRRCFGWCRPDGLRRYTRFDAWIPRKNGKSTIASGIGLYLTEADGEPGARVYAIASNREQAGEVFNEAKLMVEQSPALSSRLEVFKDSIYSPFTTSRFQAVSSKPDSKHGFNPNGAIGDEIHVWRTRELLDVFLTAVLARRQPLVHLISTAGSNIESWAHELFELAVQAQDGVFQDPSYLAVVYRALPTDDLEDPAVWAKANPNLGVSIKVENFRQMLQAAKRDPGAMASVKRLNFNIWAQDTDAWLDLEVWKSCAMAKRPALAAYRGRQCYVGLDLSENQDLTTAQLLFPNKNGTFDVVSVFWCPKEIASLRTTRDRVPYEKWIEEGWMLETEGNVLDVWAVQRELIRIRDECGIDIVQIVHDAWGCREISKSMREHHGFTMFPMGQGYKSMSEPAKLLQRLILNRKIRNDGSPVMNWNVANVKVQSDPAANIKPVKEHSKSRKRVDGVVALVMALERASLEEDGRSVYEDRGVIVI